MILISTSLNTGVLLSKSSGIEEERLRHGRVEVHNVELGECAGWFILDTAEPVYCICAGVPLRWSSIALVFPCPGVPLSQHCSSYMEIYGSE